MKSIMKKIGIKDNKGLSMVEMIAAMVIMSLIGLGVGGLIVSGSKYFNRTTAETDLQTEAQLVKNYLNNLVVDTPIAIGYNTAWEEYTEDSKQIQNPCLIVCGKETVYFIGLDNKDHTMHYLEADRATAIQYNETDGKYEIKPANIDSKISEWELLADHIDNFEMNLGKINNGYRIFNCKMDLSVRGRTYSTSHTINLRNDIFNGVEDLEETYAAAAMIDPTVTAVLVTPEDTTCAPGGEVQYDATVLGRNYPSQAVNWYVYSAPDGTGKVEAGTKIGNDGLLQVDEKETARTLYIFGESQLNPKFSGTGVVRIGQVDDIDIRLKEGDEVKPDDDGCFNIGQSVPLEPVLSGLYADDATVKVVWTITKVWIPERGSGVDWQEEQTITDPDEIKKYATLSTSGNSLFDSHGVRVKLVPGLIQPGSIVYVKAIASMGGVEVGQDKPEFQIKVSTKDTGDIVIKADTFQLLRNGELIVRGELIGYEQEIKWSLSDDLNGKIKLGKTPIGDLTIRADNTIDYDKEYKIQLIATATIPDTGEVKTEKQTLTISKVSIAFDPTSAIVVAGSPARIKLNIAGLNGDASNVTFKVSPAVKYMIAPYYTNGNMVVAISIPENGKLPYNSASTTITATLRNAGTVTGEIKVLVLKSNVAIEGYNYCYVPVPGDVTNLVPTIDGHANLPVSGRYCEVNGVRYTYFSDVDSNTWGFSVKVPSGETLIYDYVSHTGQFEKRRD